MGYEKLHRIFVGYEKFPKKIADTARKAEEYARGIMTGGTLFEELGFFYLGPIDGHNLDHLLPILRNLEKSKQYLRAMPS